MNLPNLLSVSRIFLMPFILWALWSDSRGLLLALMLAAVATDFGDGWLARRLGQVTEEGKVLDPLADKICLGSMAVALWLWRGFPWWAAALILMRDGLILLGGLSLMGRWKKVPSSNWPGKVAATVTASAIIFYAMGWRPWGFYILLTALALAILSGVIYIHRLFPKGNGR